MNIYFNLQHLFFSIVHTSPAWPRCLTIPFIDSWGKHVCIHVILCMYEILLCYGGRKVRNSVSFWIVYFIFLIMFYWWYNVIRNFDLFSRLCESITRTCLTYCCLSLVFNLIGVYFFVVETKNTLTSPALSRHKNADCIFLFFDK